MQGFQLFPIMEQRDVEKKNLLRIHTPISFKLLKELKTPYTQYHTIAPFTQNIYL